MVDNDITLIRKFPEPKTFTESEWNARFPHANVIIHCHENDFHYPNHLELLSVKCAFGGNEYYIKERCKYSVSSHNFLILNEGTHYSSYIQSKSGVESLAIIFNSNYKSEASRVLLETDDRLIDQPFDTTPKEFFFEEKLFAYNLTISKFINSIRELTKNLPENAKAINELLYFLLEALMLNNSTAIGEMNNIEAIKFSTRKEIYRRLNEVKDYIDSCYNEDITLHDLAGIALMSPFHLLRQFKKNYRITPHEYIMKQRVEHSKKIMVETENSLTDICFMIGYP